MGLLGISGFASPLISQYFALSDFAKLQRLARLAARGTLGAASVTAVLMIAFGNELLRLFGNGFDSAYLPLLVLLLGEIAAGAAGPVGYFLTMTGRQTTATWIEAVTCAVAVALAPVLVPRYGILGAAIVVALGALYAMPRCPWWCGANSGCARRRSSSGRMDLQNNPHSGSGLPAQDAAGKTGGSAGRRFGLWFGLLLVIVCAVYASHVRLSQLSAWKNHPEQYIASGVPMMTTLDAYYDLRLARLYAAGTFVPHGPVPARHYSRPEQNDPNSWYVQREPETLPLLSRMLAVFSPLFGGDIDRTGLLLAPLLSSLFMIPLFLCCWRLGVPVAGLMGGLVASFSASGSPDSASRVASASEFRATPAPLRRGWGFAATGIRAFASAGAGQTTAAVQTRVCLFHRGPRLLLASMAGILRVLRSEVHGRGNGRLASSQCGDLALERARQAEPKRACEFVTVKGSGRGGNAEQDICLQNRVDLARMSATLPPASERDLRAIPPRVRSDSP